MICGRRVSFVAKTLFAMLRYSFPPIAKLLRNIGFPYLVHAGTRQMGTDPTNESTLTKT